MGHERPGTPEFSEHWRAYHDAVEARPYNPFLDTLEPFLPPPGHALDAGCGTGKSTVWLIERGFTVDAFDADPEAVARFRDRLAGDARASARVATFAEVSLGPCDVALGVFSLFFCPREEMEGFFHRMVEALRPGGVFGGQLLGEGDSWASEDTAPLTRAEALRLLGPLETLHFEEARRRGTTVTGAEKDWHIYHVVARKPLSASGPSTAGSGPA